MLREDLEQMVLETIEQGLVISEEIEAGRELGECFELLETAEEWVRGACILMRNSGPNLPLCLLLLHFEAIMRPYYVSE